MDPEQAVQGLEAQIQMGVNFYRGLGVPQDFAEAVKSFRLAAFNGRSSAQTFLGTCYELG
jgi:uncharacterized protein